MNGNMERQDKSTPFFHKSLNASFNLRIRILHNNSFNENATYLWYPVVTTEEDDVGELTFELLVLLLP